MKKIFLALIILSVMGSLAFSQPANCVNPTAMTSPFAKDGAGTFCFVVDCMGANINSWNMDSVQINGVDYTNKYCDGIYNCAPWVAPMNGKYYIYYKASYAWSHFEMTGTCVSSGTPAPTPEVTTPPIIETVPPVPQGNVWIMPVTQTVAGGTNFTVQIHANTLGTAIGAFGFNVSYDPALVTVNAAIGSSGVEGIATGINLTVNNDTANKIIKIGGFNTSGVTGGTDVSMVTVNFTAASVTAVSTATLSLAVINLNDPNGTLIPNSTPGNATVTINPPVNPPTVEPTILPTIEPATPEITTPPIANASVFFVPATQSVTAGANFTEEIHATSSAVIGAFGYTVTYDSTLLTFVSAQAINSSISLVVNPKPASNQIVLAGFSTTGIPAGTDVPMVSVTFAAIVSIASVTTTNLTLTVQNFADFSGAAISLLATPIIATITINPVVIPTTVPTDVPTPEITAVPPTGVPTEAPTPEITVEPPTAVPTDVPTPEITAEPPTAVPTDVPTPEITAEPPTAVPTDVPTPEITAEPPTAVPTDVPTPEITAEPPTAVPTDVPTPEITAEPPTAVPTDVPTPEITAEPPTAVPTDVPTPEITAEPPTAVPTDVPTPEITAVPQPQPGAAWIIPVTQSVANGTAAKIVIHVNSGTSLAGTYGINVTYDSNILGAPPTYPITVAAEPTGFFIAANTSVIGTVSATGFDTAGKGPSIDLALFNVTFTAIGTGTSQLGLTIRTFTDPLGVVIGTPATTGGSITVN
jgi:hypothetical protein